MITTSFDKGLGDIYFISNTPHFLYKKMRQNSFVQHISQLPAEQLISEFNKRANTPIVKAVELAEVYAFFISLTFKDMWEVGDFFKTALNIKFEWFAAIAKLYLQNYTPPPIIQCIVPSDITSIEQFKVYNSHINFNIQ